MKSTVLEFIFFLFLILTTGLDAEELPLLDGFKISEKFSRKCDQIRRVPDGSLKFLFRNADHGGSVMLSDKQFDFDRMQLWSFKKKQHEEVSKRIKFRKLAHSMRYTGRANGFRQHWRDNRTLQELPEKRLAFRGRTVVDGQPIFPCYILTNVEARND